MIKKIGFLGLITLLVSSLSSCGPFKGKEYKQECKQVVAAFNESFVRQESGVFLLKEGHSFSTFANLYNTNFTRCFDGLHKEDLIKLLGEPSKKEEGGYLYYLNKKCQDYSLAGCYSFSFLLDQNREYVQMAVYLSESEELKQ